MRVMRQLQRVGQQTDALIAGVARGYGLSHAALNALAVVEGANGPVPVGEITAQMHITTASTTSILDTLERNGFVRRQPDPDDRRRVLVDVTHEGQALLDRVLPAVQQRIAATLTPLDDAALTDLLRALDTVAGVIADAPSSDELAAPPKRRSPRRLRRV
jgi:DNA-binding MarR family transcriptional regulator